MSKSGVVARRSSTSSVSDREESSLGSASLSSAQSGSRSRRTESPPYSPEEIEKWGLRPDRLPRHIAIIMDGNGRWARSRGKPRIEGHRQGVKSVQAIVEESARLGLDQLTLYCLSSENWKRPRLELDLLMSLLQRYVVAEREQIMRQDIRFCTIGRREKLGRKVLSEVQKTIDLSAENKGMRLCLALNYGARAEIVDAVKQIAEESRSGQLVLEEINEQTVSDHLYTAGMCDPDLVIRTAGEMRISNFLLWQISYAELWVTQTCWPDFRQADLHLALQSFAARDRRFGGLNEK